MRTPIRHILITASLACGLLAGCSNNVWRSAAAVVSAPFKDAPPFALSRAEISEIPYATMMAQVATSIQPAMLVLAEKGPRGEEWHGANNIVVTLRNGRLRSLIGLGYDLRDMELTQEDPLIDVALQRTGPQPVERLMYYIATKPYYEVLSCKLEFEEQETITILEVNFTVNRVTEKCSAEPANWKFTNTYWVDPYDGFIWKSIQYFNKELPPLRLSVLKPAG